MPDFQIFKGNNKKILKMFKHDSIVLLFVIFLAIFIGILIAGSIMFYSNQQNSNTIQSGVFIKGINVSGLTKQEAIKLVTNELHKQMNDHLELTYKNYNYYLEVEQIEAKFDIESSVNYALNIAKTGNFLNDMEKYILVLTANINIEPVLTYNENALISYLETIQANLPDQVQQYGYYIEDDELIITNGSNGVEISVDDLKNIIIESIQDISYSNEYIQIPTHVKYPDPINVESIHSDVYREVQNAYFTTEPYAVFPDVTGVDFDIDKAKEIIENNPEAEEYAIELNYKKADITVNDLGKEAFPDLVGSYITKYNARDTDRTTNLRLAAEKINGTVVMPGEIFSYNKVVGKRTIEAGYKEAPIYQDGGVTDGLGGGICQISTTLYNAAIEANMEIEQRRNHMFVPSYAEAGKDATVVWGSTDFQFKNRRDYPIKIEAQVTGGIASVKIYGLHMEDEYELFIDTKTIKSTSTSLVVESYRAYRRDGKIVKRDKLYTDTYKVH